MYNWYSEVIAQSDFDVKQVSSDTLQKLEDRVNEEIRLARPVTMREVIGDDIQNIPESVRSRGVPLGLNSLRLIEIAGYSFLFFSHQS